MYKYTETMEFSASEGFSYLVQMVIQKQRTQMGQQTRYPRPESYGSLLRKRKKCFFVLTLVYKVTERTNEHAENILQLQSLVKHKQNT